MNLLIDAVVRQTTVLIAQLATAAGTRATLAHTANQVFIDLVRELKEQGLGNKVIADMFGLALRTYHAKVQRLQESNTFRGRSLWEAILEYLQDKKTVQQTDVLARFRNDDEATVRGVLADLVGSGLVFRSGRGAQLTYRAAEPEELKLTSTNGEQGSISDLIWVAVHRDGPLSLPAIVASVAIEPSVVEAALQPLLADGRVQQIERDGEVKFSSDHCVIPLGATHGWEAAVFDHYQALVAALCNKLAQGVGIAKADDRVGGSTYSYTVWQGHPHYDEVVGFLARQRRELSQLRERVVRFNEQTKADSAPILVTAYLGQNLVEEDPGAMS
ncbi:MAG TPA: hypothetical protein VHO25_15325 [Polyangiaceae bacterium]|nr:hypothetical protein [Polyangiaceae bacterium]